MDYVYLADFFVSYSLPTVIIACIVAVCSMLFNKFLAKKVAFLTHSYVPFLMAITLYLAFDMIFISKAFTINAQSFYAGLLSGSLSLVITSIINRIKKGKPLTVSQTVLIIEGILSGYVHEQNLSSTARALEEEITLKGDTTSPDVVANIIKSNSDMRLTDEDYFAIAKLILTAVIENRKNNTKETK